MSELTSDQSLTIEAHDCRGCGAAAGHPCYPTCTSTWAPETPTFQGVPHLPSGHRAGNGFGWIDQLPTGWHPVPAWGRNGWDLGEWPHVIVAHFDHPEGHVYAVATYAEGDVDARAFTTRAERDAETDHTAAALWRDNGAGPLDLPLFDHDLGTHQRGPADLTRLLANH